MHAYRLLCVIWIIQLSIDRFVVIWMEHSQFSPGNRVSDTIDVYYRTFNVFWMKQTQSERLSWKSIKISWMIPLLKCELGNFTIKLHNVDKTTINVCCNSIIENRIIVVTPKIRMLDLIMTSIETRRPQSNLVKQLITVRNAQWSHRIEYRKVDITEIANAISDNSINKLFHLVFLRVLSVELIEISFDVFMTHDCTLSCCIFFSLFHKKWQSSGFCVSDSMMEFFCCSATNCLIKHMTTALDSQSVEYSDLGVRMHTWRKITYWLDDGMDWWWTSPGNMDYRWPIQFCVPAIISHHKPM